MKTIFDSHHRKIILLLILTFSTFLSGCNHETPTQIKPESTDVPTLSETAEPSLVPTESPTPTSIPILTITVTTIEDVADSASVTLSDLIIDPGPDGVVSLREAVTAANGTPGHKIIGFDPNLMGLEIQFESSQKHDEPRLVLTGEDITINGDINNDGVADILLNGKQMDSNHSSAFIVSGRNILIENLDFMKFQKFAVMIACSDPTCSTKPLHDIRILNNQINSDNGGGGVMVMPLNSCGESEDLSSFSNMEISNLEITGNTIEIIGGLNGGIFMHAAGGGVSNNRLSNVLINDNQITSPGVTITVNAADATSTWFGFPGPLRFSDNSTIENLTIKDNYLDPRGVGADSARPTGILLLAGNMGNSGNFIRKVVLSGNEVSANAETGISVYATMIDSFSYETDPFTGERINTIEDLLIENNTINAWMNSIKLIASSGEYYTPIGGQPSSSGEMGRLTNIRILSNQLQGFQFEAVVLFGGAGSSDNQVDGVLLEDNIITSKDPTKGVAVFTYAGGCSGCTRPSERNTITGLVIQNNTVTCNNFIWLSGGTEEYAHDNRIEFYLGENELNPDDSVISIEQSAWKELQGNSAIQLDSIP